MYVPIIVNTSFYINKGTERGLGKGTREGRFLQHVSTERGTEVVLDSIEMVRMVPWGTVL